MLKLLLFTIIFCTMLNAQDNILVVRLYNDFELYKENTLQHRRFKHQDIQKLIDKVKENKLFTVDSVGRSTEGREINLITFGSGPTKVFLWSQMHGDEPTATQAIFDIINYITKNAEEDEIQFLSSKLTLYFMPMVNPDGAERFQRRTIQDIDINRDFLKKQTDEANVLYNTFDKIRPHFGFNLHDQKKYYTAGSTYKSAVLSFLAPAPNEQKEVTSNRGDAMRLISKLYRILSPYVPGHIAKYDDDHEPRAFGDNFQKKGMATILIESGGWKDDPEKQFIRKLNFIALITAFHSIATRSYLEEDINTYNQIPFNKESLNDLLLKDLAQIKKNKKAIVDIGINHLEIVDSNSFYYLSYLEDIGDLSTSYGYEEINLSGYTLEEGKVYETTLSSMLQVADLDFISLYKKGILFVKVKTDEDVENFTEYPINLIVNRRKISKSLKLEQPVNLVIKKDGEVEYVVVNGFLYDVKNDIGTIKNGIIY